VRGVRWRWKCGRVEREGVWAGGVREGENHLHPQRDVEAVRLEALARRRRELREDDVREAWEGKAA